MGAEYLHLPGNGFHDWVGCAALQEDISYGPRLEALAGLDRAEWLCVGILVVTEPWRDNGDTVYLDMVNLPSLGIQSSWASFTDLACYATTRGALPVTRIQLTGMDMPELLTLMTRGALHFRANGITDIETVVIAREHKPAVIAQ